MHVSATAVRFDDNSMWVELSDGRTIGVPYAWFSRLLNATPKQREAVEIGRFGLRDYGDSCFNIPIAEAADPAQVEAHQQRRALGRLSRRPLAELCFPGLQPCQRAR